MRERAGAGGAMPPGPTGLNRREFLKAAGIAAAASALPRCGADLEAQSADPDGAAGSADLKTGTFHFLHMADPQLFWGDDALGKWRRAIGHAKRLTPAFVVVGGDLINRNGDAAKVDLEKDEERARAYLEVARSLGDDIPLFNVAGNHDVCNRPTPATLAWYEKRFGKPWYSFTHGGCLFIVLESDILKFPEGAPDEAKRQLDWLGGIMRASAGTRYRHRIVFMHHPMCLKSVDEKDSYFNMPTPVRRKLLALFREHGVAAVFSGHYHGNAAVRAVDVEKPIQLVTTSAVGKPLRSDPPGFRIVKVTPERIEHAYHALDDMPDLLE